MRSAGRVSLLVLVLLGFFAVVGLWLAGDRSQVSTAVGNPPQIADITKIVLNEPTTGSTVIVDIQAGALTGNVDTVWARNVTLDGPSAAWRSGSYKNGTGSVKITGGVGDLVEFKVEDLTETPPSEEDTVGFIPEPTDIARPDYDAGKLGTTFTSSTFEVTINTKGVFDQSWPVVADLGLYGAAPSATASVASTNGTYNTSAPVLSMTAAHGDRAVLLLTDDLGNRREVHFIVGTGAASDITDDTFPNLSSYRPSGSYVDAERTGRGANVAPGVILGADSFIWSENLLSLRGRALDVLVTLHHRSAMEYDGPVGQGWDWSLDARFDKVSGTYDYWPGDGLVHEGFTTVPASPTGIFDVFATPSDWTLSSADGSFLEFDSKTGLLKAIEDPYNNRIDIVRDDSDRVAELVDDKGRRTAFAWFDTGRLASVTDFGGRQTLLDYDTDGRLTRLTRPNDAFVDWAYDGTSSRLKTIYELTDDGDTPRKLLEMTYHSSGAVATQRDVYNMYVEQPLGEGTTFGEANPTGSPHTGDPAYPTWASTYDNYRVKDPEGNCTDYGVHKTSFNELCVMQRHYGDLRNGAPWSSDPDPDWVETWLEVDSNNLLLSARYFHHENQGASPPKLEREEWTYVSSQDPREKRLVSSHRYLEHGSTTNVFAEETWQYPTTGNATYWPDEHVDVHGRKTYFTYSAEGRLEELERSDVTAYPDTSATYDIVTKWTYGTSGLLEETRNPNRNLLTNPQPSVKYTYYTTGFEEGWLKKMEHLDSAGATRLFTEYEYDEFGNAILIRDQAGQVTEYVYDSLDRQEEEQYSVTIYPDTTSTGVEIDQVMMSEYTGPRLTKQSQTHFDEAGTSQGTVVLQKYSLVESTTTSEYQEISERGLTTGSPQEFSKSTTTYNARGFAVLQEEVYDVQKSTEETRTYDALGQLYSTEVDPSVSTGDEIQSYYSYDYAGRQVQRFETNWDHPALTVYDNQGRRIQQVSTRVALGRGYKETVAPPGDPHESSQFGHFIDIYEYDDANSRPFELSRHDRRSNAAVTPASPGDSTWAPTTYTLISRENYTYDEAGRRYKTEQLVETGSPDVYAVTAQRLYAGGQTERDYVPEDAQGQDDYSETVLDDLDRVVERISLESGIKSKTTYNSTTGRVDSTEEVSSASYTTTYVYDERGRVIQQARDGTTDIVEYTAYDGFGRIVRTESKQGTDFGGYNERRYDLGGRLINEKEGRQGNLLYTENRYAYDRKGRMTKSEQRADKLPADDWLETTYTYDDADRKLTVTMPKYLTQSRVRTLEYSFTSYDGSIALPTVTVTEPNTLEKETISNQLGSTLVEKVVSSPTHVEGPILVEYAYAGTIGCGCASAASPVEVRTLHTADEVTLDDTIVRRSYGLRGEVQSEETLILRYSSGAPAGDKWIGRTVSFFFDKRGRETQVDYPSGASLTRVYRDDGMVTSQSVDTGSGAAKVVDYTYQGTRQKNRLVYDGQGVLPANEVAEGGPSFDEFGRSYKMDWDASVDYLDEYKDLTPDGLLVERERGAVLPVTDEYKYTGPGWISEELVAKLTAEERTRNWSYDATGAVTNFTDTQHSHDWDYTYPAAATEVRWVQSITDTEYLYQSAILRNSAGGSGPTLVSAWIGRDPGGSASEDRAFTYDLSGNRLTYSYDFQNALTCQGQESGTYKEYDVSVQEDYTYDAWGRVLEWERDATGDQRTVACIEGAPDDFPVTWESAASWEPLTRSNVYDGFGRVVCREVSGHYCMYLDDEFNWAPAFTPLSTFKAVTAESVYPDEEYFAYGPSGLAVVAHYNGASVDPDSAPDTERELYLNPNTGFVDKGRQFSPGTGAAIPLTDDAFTTQLDDLEGRVVSANWGSCAASPELSLSVRTLALSEEEVSNEGSGECFVFDDDFVWIFNTPVACGCGPDGKGFPRKRLNCMAINIYGKTLKNASLGHASIGETASSQVGLYSGGYQIEKDFSNVVRVYECCCLSDKEYEVFKARLSAARKCAKEGKKVDIGGNRWQPHNNMCHNEVLDIARSLGCPNLQPATAPFKRRTWFSGGDLIKYLESKKPYCRLVGSSDGPSMPN